VQALTAKQYAHLFVPKLFTILRGEYRWNHLRDDTLAGLTVAVVALPLAMALASTHSRPCSNAVADVASC